MVYCTFLENGPSNPYFCFLFKEKVTYQDCFSFLNTFGTCKFVLFFLHHVLVTKISILFLYVVYCFLFFGLQKLFFCGIFLHPDAKIFKKNNVEFSFNKFNMVVILNLSYRNEIDIAIYTQVVVSYYGQTTVFQCICLCIPFIHWF